TPAARACLSCAASNARGGAMRQHYASRRIGRLAAAIFILLAACAPALAADLPCTDGDIDTDQGIEDGEGATGENTTCHPEASAYGWSNIASGNFSNAFGYLNIARGARASAIGSSNTAATLNANAIGYGNNAANLNASAYAASAIGSFNTANGVSSSALGYDNDASGASSSAVGGIFDTNGDGSTSWVGERANR